MSWGHILLIIYVVGFIFVSGVMVGSGISESFHREITWREIELTEIGQCLTATVFWPLVIPGTALLALLGL
jgi:K+-transporting ATPase A subunit